MSRWRASLHLTRVDSPTRLDPDALLAEAGFVRRLARALLRRDDLAHDVAQEVLVAALRAEKPPQDLRGWLVAVTRRFARRIGGRERARATIEAAAAPPDGDDRTHHTAERLELQRRLCDAVGALPEPHRTTVTLRFFDDLPPRAIAARLGTTSEVVRQRLHRGITMLRERLDGEFGDRQRWTHAFGALGLAPAGSPWLLLTVLAMNKLLLAAAALSVVGAFWFWPHETPPPAPSPAPGPIAAPGTPVSTTGTAPAASPVDATPAGPPDRVADATCTFVVVDARGTAIAAADVHCWSGGSPPVQRRTDAHGRADFGALIGPGAVLVATDGRFPHVERLADRAGEHRITLADGTTLRGELLVDGAPPAQAWRLAIEPVALDSDVPAALAERFAWGRGCGVRVDAAGQFAFAGLPADWRGSIRLPQPLWLLPESQAGDERSLAAVRAAQGHVRLLTTQLDTLRVRVVWQDDGAPVADASCGATAEFADGTRTPYLSVSSDERGVVQAGLSPASTADHLRWCDTAKRPAVKVITFSATAPGADGRVEATFTRETWLAAAEHEVRLPRAAAAHFLAVDAAGAPIAGARVLANGASEPTGRDGRGTFRGGAKDVRCVGAPGCVVGPCEPRGPASGTRDDPLVFVLQPANSLRLRFVDGDGRALVPPRTELRTASPAFTSGAFPTALDEAFGTTARGGSATPVTLADGMATFTDCTVLVEVGPAGEAVLHSLVPGCRGTVVALDAMQRTIATLDLTLPPAGEPATATIVVPGKARQLHGRVVGANGGALRAATVSLGLPGDTKALVHTRSDDDGQFSFTGLFTTSPLRLVAAADGHLAQRIELPPLADDTPDVAVQLEAGRVVTVRVVDETGAPLDLEPELLGGGMPRDHDKVDRGVKRWRALPDGVVTFRCRIGGDVFTIDHDTRQPECVLKVPKPAQLSLSLPRDGFTVPTDAEVVAKVFRTDGSGEPCVLTATAFAAGRAFVPGRYRVELFARTWNGTPRTPSDRLLPPCAEVTLTAGEHADAELR